MITNLYTDTCNEMHHISVKFLGIKTSCYPFEPISLCMMSSIVQNLQSSLFFFYLLTVTEYQKNRNGCQTIGFSHGIAHHLPQTKYSTSC